MSFNEEFNSGPDGLYPADSFTSTDLSKGVKLRLNDNTPSKYKPISIYTMFKNTVDKNPDHEALAFKTEPNGPWCKFSYLEYWKTVNKAAKSFIKVNILF
jgi:hypothetical protein